MHRFGYRIFITRYTVIIHSASFSRIGVFLFLQTVKSREQFVSRSTRSSPRIFSARIHYSVISARRSSSLERIRFGRNELLATRIEYLF